MTKFWLWIRFILAEVLSAAAVAEYITDPALQLVLFFFLGVLAFAFLGIQLSGLKGD